MGLTRNGKNSSNCIICIMSSILIKNATIVNEGTVFRNDLLIKDELISAIGLSENWKIPERYNNY